MSRCSRPGGYGRGELAPFSDLDLLLVHDLKAKEVRSKIEPIATALWYPLWDAGVKLGHAVRTLKEQVDLAKTDLDSATALLDRRARWPATTSSPAKSSRPASGCGRPTVRQHIESAAGEGTCEGIGGDGGRLPARSRSEGWPRWAS